MLRITDLTKAYDGRTVLTVPALHLSAGIHYVRGHNGSGKTTFFRTIAGLLAFSGRILLDDHYEINRDPVDYRLRVSYAEAEPRYPPFLSPRELTGFVGRAKQAPAGQTDELAELLGVNAFWTQPTGTFSSGMLKKLSLLLALLGRPRLLLLDEPLTTLDVTTADRLFAHLRTLNADQGVSLLLTSHQDIALTGLPLTTRWLVADGRLTPERLTPERLTPDSSSH